jgi:F-type H+-transporting ATPase subunit c
MLQARMFLMLGLTDAVPIISIAFAALLMFANPFLGQVG